MIDFNPPAEVFLAPLRASPSSADDERSNTGASALEAYELPQRGRSVPWLLGHLHQIGDHVGHRLLVELFFQSLGHDRKARALQLFDVDAEDGITRAFGPS